MTREKALEALEYYQKWRLGAEMPMLPPKEITEALGVAIEALRDARQECAHEYIAVPETSGGTQGNLKAKCRKCGHMP